MKPHLPICSLEILVVIYNALRSWVKKSMLCYFILLYTSLGAQPLDIKFDRFDQWANAPRGSIQHIQQDKAGFLWLSTATNQVRFDGNEFQVFPLKSIQLADNQLGTQFTDKKGNHWYGDSLLRWQAPKTKSLQTFRLPPGTGICRALFFHPQVTGDSVLWILTSKALHCFDLKRKQFVRNFQYRSHDRQSLYGAAFRSAFFSKEGILWLIGETGFCKYDWRNQEFRQYDLNPGKRSGGGELNFVQGLAGDSTKCWVTTSDMGLLQYDLLKHQISPLKQTGGLLQLTQRGSYGLAYDKLGRLWVGGVTDSIVVYDVKKNRIVQWIPLHGDLLHFIDSDFRRGFFWYLLDQNSPKTGLIRIEPVSMKIDTFWVPYWQKRPKRIIMLLPDYDGTLWFIHDNTFIEYFNPQPRMVGQKALSSFSTIDIDFSKFYCLRNDALRKSIWLMSDEALLKLDWENQTAYTYYNAQQRPDEKYVRIHLDDLGQVWIQCFPSNALYRFNPKKETFARYDWSDGLPVKVIEGLEPNRVGKKWSQRFHDHTFLLFDPLKLPVIPANQPLISSVRLGNRTKEHSFDAHKQDQSSIKTKQRAISITFTSIDFAQGRNLQFRYQLMGVDTAWVRANSDREANYTGLPLGNYQFKVMAANREGEWNPVPAILPISIRPAFYTQIWFWLLCAVFISGLFYWGVRRWEKRQQRKYQIRQLIADDLHEQVGSALDSIHELSTLHHTSTHKFGLLERIETHTNSAAEKLSDLIWLLNPGNDTLAQVVQRIDEYAHRHLAPLHIIPNIILVKGNPQLRIALEKREYLYQQFKTNLVNLLKQSTFTHLTIHIAQENRQIKMEFILMYTQENTTGLAPDQHSLIMDLNNPLVELKS
ncbi:triple tyrosine motif-containing protein [Haliscomenobacter sp.]|uniref:ligand-binding sensor domain-containing protein n=1 Tax=Haliscomenobacter sp. TaxID=2717303 RepID=UPI0035931CD8